MEKKIGHITTPFFGKRRWVHPSWNTDPLYYVKVHLDKISKLNTKLHKFYIVCTSATPEILSELREITKNDKSVVILERENTGGSYCSWKHALHVDNGECDYMILTEDDYTLNDPNAVNYMLEYFNETPELFFLCMKWMKTQPVFSHLNDMHAGMTYGMMDNKLYHTSRATKNIDVKTYCTPTSSLFINQVLFVDDFYNAGYMIKDFTDKYSSIYSMTNTETMELGNPDGIKLIVPIISQFFK